MMLSFRARRLIFPRWTISIKLRGAVVDVGFDAAGGQEFAGSKHASTKRVFVHAPRQDGLVYSLQHSEREFVGEQLKRDGRATQTPAEALDRDAGNRRV